MDSSTLQLFLSKVDDLVSAFQLPQKFVLEIVNNQVKHYLIDALAKTYNAISADEANEYVKFSLKEKTFMALLKFHVNWWMDAKNKGHITIKQ